MDALNALMWLLAAATAVCGFVYIAWATVNWRSLRRVERVATLGTLAMTYVMGVMIGLLDWAEIAKPAPTQFFKGGGFFGSPPPGVVSTLYYSCGIIFLVGLLMAFLKLRYEHQEQKETYDLQRRTPTRDLQALIEEYGFLEAMNVLRRKFRKR